MSHSGYATHIMQVVQSRSFSRLRLATRFLSAVLVLLALSVSMIYGQPVHPDVNLEQPRRNTANLLQQLRHAPNSQIGLLFSEKSIEASPEGEAIFREAARQWEQFLIGHELPYRVLEDTSLTHELPAALRLLILPSAEVLSETQKDVLKAYLQRGGGIIASGRTGFYDESGIASEPRFFEDVFGAEPSITIPDTLQGLLQMIDGGHVVSEGVPAGFRLNVTRPFNGVAAVPVTSTAIGVSEGYEASANAFNDGAGRVSSLVLYGDYEAGRFVWFGFAPQDVSPDVRQQAVYQTLLLNAMAYVSRTPMISLGRWPSGYSSASAFAMLPSHVYRPYSFRTSLDVVTGALERAHAPATGFFVTDHAGDHPDLLSRFAELGQLAIYADSPELLDGLPYSLQQERLEKAAASLQKIYPSEFVGFHPPGGYFDDATLRAAVDTGVDYLMLTDDVLTSPTLLPWEDLLDYRDSLLNHVRHDALSSAYSFEPEESSDRSSAADIVAFYPTLYSYELSNTSRREAGQPMEVWSRLLRQDFERVHEAEGLFLFAFELEAMGLSVQRAGVLEQIAHTIHAGNSWFASLGDIREWWVSRGKVVVDLSAGSDSQDYEITIHNTGDVPLSDVSLNFRHEAAQSVPALDAPGLSVTAVKHDEKLSLTIESLPPGSHTIRLIYSSI